MRIEHTYATRLGALLLAGTGLGACAGSAEVSGEGVTIDASRSTHLASGGESAQNQGTQHCDVSDDRHEQSSYDTSGDDIPDVRKVFLRVGDGDLSRLVLVCRETDLNSDGVKDIVRYYSDEGEVLREEADRDFDGQMDEVTYFQNAKVVRREFDTNGDGMVDTKTFYLDGAPLRAERDMGGHSTASKWQPDRWEYFENGRMVRAGTDIDGDGRVDRWDRDETMRADTGSLRTDEDVIDDGATQPSDEET